MLSSKSSWTTTHRQGPWDIVATFEVLQSDSGFTAMSSGVRVPSEFAVHTVLEIILDNHSQTKTHVQI